MNAPHRVTALGFASLFFLVAPALPGARACDDVSFVVTGQLFVGGPSLNVLTADFNNDFQPDLVVTNDSKVLVLLGDGTGQFDPAVSYDAGRLPRAMGSGDLDGDGRTDLVVANLEDISVLINNGAGGFKAPLSFPAGQGPNAIGSGDFNGDGHIDVAVVNRESDNVTIMLGNGEGGFDSVVNFPAGELPLNIAIGDYDNDGRLDLAISTYSSQEILILKGDGTGSFSTFNSYPLGGNATRIITADFNHDQNLDLAVGVINIFPNNHMAVFIGNGDGTFTETSDILAPDPQSLAAADYDGDGNVDLACTSYFIPNLVVALGDGTGSFAPSRKTRLPGHPYPYDLVAADFNSDHKPDLAVSNFQSRYTTILLNLATVRVGAIDPTASKEEGTKGHFKIRRDGCLDQPMTVHYTVSGTARPGLDYKALPGAVTIPAGANLVQVPVIPLGGTPQDDKMTVVLTLDPDPGFVIGREGSATVIISDK
jgi:hypothetical protein